MYFPFLVGILEYGSRGDLEADEDRDGKADSGVSQCLSFCGRDYNEEVCVIRR